MTTTHTCAWISDDPSAWRWLKKILGLLSLLTAIVSIYTIVQRSYLYWSAPGSDLPFYLSLPVPLPAEMAAYSLWAFGSLLLFQGYMIRLFVYHSLRLMCPLATPTLSERIDHAPHGSLWVQKKTRILHKHVKKLESESGLSFSQNEFQEYRVMVQQIAERLKNSKRTSKEQGAKRVVAITPLGARSLRHPLGLDFWDELLQCCGAPKSSRRSYYLIDNPTFYDQVHYEPRMERVSSGFSVASRHGELRIVYRDNPVRGCKSTDVDIHAALDRFVSSASAHYLAIEQHNNKWIYLTADLGAFGTGFYGGAVFENLDATHMSEETRLLRELVSFDSAASHGFAKWNITGNEKAGRHVYNFQKLEGNGSAIFVDWAFMLNGWTDDFLQQIREATVEAISRGIDVRRLFVVPENDRTTIAAALEEARKQVPSKDQDENVDKHMGYLECPGMTTKWWNSLVQANEVGIAKEKADFAIYTFEDGTEALYVNNFNGAPKIDDTSLSQSLKAVFENAWAERRVFL